MLDFNLEYYRVFYYVARLGNATRAAKALYISQPAVSRSIRQLEESLNVALFQRQANGMLLTTEGQKLFKHVEKAFDLLIAGEREIQLHRRNTAGTIRIAATETPLYYFLLPKIESYKHENPQVFFQIGGSSAAETIAMLRRDEADFALAVSPIKAADDLQIITGESFRDIFVAGPAFETLKGRQLGSDELVNYPLITVEKGTSARGLIDLWFQEQGLFFEPAYTVRTSTAVLPFVERNLGIGIIPDLFAKEGLQAKQLFEVTTEKPLHNREILILHKKNVPLSRLCDAFLKLLLKENKDLPS